MCCQGLQRDKRIRQRRNINYINKFKTETEEVLIENPSPPEVKKSDLLVEVKKEMKKNKYKSVVFDLPSCSLHSLDVENQTLAPIEDSTRFMWKQRSKLKLFKTNDGNQVGSTTDYTEIDQQQQQQPNQKDKSKIRMKITANKQSQMRTLQNLLELMEKLTNVKGKYRVVKRSHVDPNKMRIVKSVRHLFNKSFANLNKSTNRKSTNSNGDY